MATKWLLIDVADWETEGKPLVRGFFEAFPGLDPSNVDYLEYESGTAVVDGEEIGINRSSNVPMKTTQSYAVKVDMLQVRKMEIVENGAVVGNYVDQYLDAHPEVPVRYVDATEMRSIIAQDSEGSL